jgi:tRNA pseudouridine55 synthase
VGHAGTLDPDATGVLVMGLGRATRVLSYAQSATKAYLAFACLGVTTTTLDASGEIVDERPVTVEREELEQTAADFVGEIQQVPPMVSAVKVGGERLYAKARRGETVDRAARSVTINELELRDFRPPEFDLYVRCSAGTYIRTLVADIGESLGCGAHLKALRRTEAGGFSEKDAIPLDRLTSADLRPVAEAVNQLDRMEVDDDTAKRVSHGQRLRVTEETSVGEDEPIALVSGGDLLAVYRRKDDALVPERVLVGGES